MNCGSEKLVFEYPLRQKVKADLLMAFALTMDSPKSDTMTVRFVDCSLMQLEPGANKLVLLLLAVVIPKTEFRSHRSLWLYAVELQMPSLSSDNNQKSFNVSIIHRLLISRSVRFGLDSENPKLTSLPPSWRVFVSWSDGAYTTGNMFSVQVDVLNLPIVESLRKEEGATLEMLECKHAIDCGFLSSSINA